MIKEIHSDADERMNKTLASLEDQFSKIRAGRAHPHCLNKFKLNIMAQLFLSTKYQTSARKTREH